MEPTSKETHLRLVVVDDDPAFRSYLKDTLEKECQHIVVGEAASGEEMIKTVLEQTPDVVVLDIHLPDMDGLEALRQVEQTLPVAAVAITADRDMTLLSRALEEHVLAYLIKPVDGHQLGPAVHMAWSRFEDLKTLANENASLKHALQSRKIIERAKGVLMKRYRWTEADAFRRLQRTAMNKRMPMVALAQMILDGKNVDLGSL